MVFDHETPVVPIRPAKRRLPESAAKVVKRHAAPAVHVPPPPPPRVTLPDSVLRFFVVPGVPRESLLHAMLADEAALDQEDAPDDGATDRRASGHPASGDAAADRPRRRWWWDSCTPTQVAALRSALSQLGMLRLAERCSRLLALCEPHDAAPPADGFECSVACVGDDLVLAVETARLWFTCEPPAWGRAFCEQWCLRARLGDAYRTRHGDGGAWFASAWRTAYVHHWRPTVVGCATMCPDAVASLCAGRFVPRAPASTPTPAPTPAPSPAVTVPGPSLPCAVSSSSPPPHLPTAPRNPPASPPPTPPASPPPTPPASPPPTPPASPPPTPPASTLVPTSTLPPTSPLLPQSSTVPQGGGAAPSADAAACSREAAGAPPTESRRPAPPVGASWTARRTGRNGRVYVPIDQRPAPVYASALAPVYAPAPAPVSVPDPAALRTPIPEARADAPEDEPRAALVRAVCAEHASRTHPDGDGAWAVDLLRTLRARLAGRPEPSGSREWYKDVWACMAARLDAGSVVLAALAALVLDAAGLLGDVRYLEACDNLSTPTVAVLGVIFWMDADARTTVRAMRPVVDSVASLGALSNRVAAHPLPAGTSAAYWERRRASRTPFIADIERGVLRSLTPEMRAYVRSVPEHLLTSVGPPLDPRSPLLLFAHGTPRWSAPP